MYHPRIVRLVLASASPRRLELLRSAGFDVDVDAANVDERQRPDESPAAFVTRLAREKASAVAARHPNRPVLGADTEVVVDAAVLGKPIDRDDAARMLRQLSGRVHQVLTGVALVVGERTVSALEQTSVWMSPLSADEIAWYVASGEPMDKAGAYAIQGLAGRFIPRIEGSYSNVVGLPVAAVLQLLKQAGVAS